MTCLRWKTQTYVMIYIRIYRRDIFIYPHLLIPILFHFTRYKFGVLDGATTWIFAKDNNELFDFDELTVQGGGHLAFNSSVSLTSPVDINVGMFYGDKTGEFYF